MPGRRRRREVELERVLGTPALFATAYGNVGSSIYYALGLTAVYALGLTPLVFVLAGIVFAATAATYAEGTARFPEAGGSASFSRHAFDELVSFTAGWAQMLVYVVTVAVSAFFVPHYLSIFWEPLRTNPGTSSAARSSSSCSSPSTWSACRRQRGCRSPSRSSTSRRRSSSWRSASRSSSAPKPWSTTSTGASRRPGRISQSPSRLRCWPTRGWRPSPTSRKKPATPCERCRTRTSSSPEAVFAIYFTLPLVALSALPVERIDGELTTLLALPPEEGGYANDPILGVVQNIGIEGFVRDAAEIYVGILAATILVIATNAGVIGASRITYSMASYRQLPEALRRLHPRFKTPWLSLVLFAGIAPILVILPGDVNFVGTLYSLGATLSFTVAHASIIRLRMLDGDDAEIPYRARPNVSLRGVAWPLFAILGGIATGISFLVLVVQNPATRWVGLGWMILGLVGYLAYRRRYLRVSLRSIEKAPPAFGPALALEYRRLVVPVITGQPSDDAMDVACRLAAERGSRIVALNVLEIPLDLPLAEELPEVEALANRELDEAVAIGDSYGVRVVGRLERARSAAKAIVAEADARDAEIIVIGSPRRRVTGSQAACSGRPWTTSSNTPPAACS